MACADTAGHFSVIVWIAPWQQNIWLRFQAHAASD
jgi:hypothetical protein